jgi:hypothetical protein
MKKINKVMHNLEYKDKNRRLLTCQLPFGRHCRRDKHRACLLNLVMNARDRRTAFRLAGGQWHLARGDYKVLDGGLMDSYAHTNEH